MLAADRLEMGRPATPRRRTRRSLLETAPLIQTNAGNGRAGGAQRPPRAAGGTAPDRLAARPGRLDRARDPPPPRRLSPQPDPARTRPALRTRTARRALTHRRQAARAHPTAPRPPNRPALRRQRQSRLGLPVRLRRRQNTARSLRLLPARNNRLSPRLPQRLPPLLPPTRNRDRRSPHRQRQMLPTHLERQLPRKRHQTAPHPHPPPPDKRQSRTLHPNTPHRMDPTPHLRLQPTPHRRTPHLPRPLQSPPPTPRPKRTHTHPGPSTTSLEHTPGSRGCLVAGGG